MKVVFEHSHYSPSDWEEIMDKFQIPEEERFGWITSIEVEVSDPKITRPASKLTWEEAESIAMLAYGPMARLKYDDWQKGYWIHVGCSGKFFRDEEILALKGVKGRKMP